MSKRLGAIRKACGKDVEFGVSVTDRRAGESLLTCTFGPFSLYRRMLKNTDNFWMG